MSTVSVTVRVTDKSGHTATDTATAEVQDFNLVVNAGQDAAALINAQPAGTPTAPRRYLVNGTHRLTATVVPKSDTELTINGTLTGDVVLTGWLPDGTDRWSTSGKLPAAYSDGGVPEFTSGPHANACKWREDLFVNGVMLKRVTILSAVASNTFYADYTANKIYLGQDPSGKTVEMSKLQYAIKSTAARVKILGNWSIKHFATPSQNGALQPEGADWVIEGGVVQWVHAVGLKLSNSHRTVVRGTFLQDCGQLGYSNATSHDTQWLSCRFRWNNNALYKIDDWESGGGKTSRSSNAYFWDCWSLFNKGVGFWNDIDNDGTQIMWCRSEDNSSCGIRDEIGWNSKIGHNVVLRNGLYHRADSGAETTAGKDPGFYATAGINVNSSGGRNGGQTRIFNNTVLDNRNGISVQQRNRTKDGVINPEWVLRNVLVENNKVRSAILINPTTETRWVDANSNPVSSWSGVGALSQTATRSAEIYNTDVVFRNNQYASTERIMRWTGSSWTTGTLAQAQAAGQEAGSVVAGGF